MGTKARLERQRCSAYPANGLSLMDPAVLAMQCRIQMTMPITSLEGSSCHAHVNCILLGLMAIFVLCYSWFHADFKCLFWAQVRLLAVGAVTE